MVILQKTKQYSDGIKAANNGDTDPAFVAAMEMAFITGATAIALIVSKALDECTPENCTAFFRSLRVEADAISSACTSRAILDKMMGIRDNDDTNDLRSD